MERHWHAGGSTGHTRISPEVGGGAGLLNPGACVVPAVISGTREGSTNRMNEAGQVALLTSHRLID